MDSPMFAWRGTDDPGRLDLATVSLGSDSMSAHGTSLTPSYASSWYLDVGEGWITRSLLVQVNGSQRGQRWSRSLLLERATDGRWDTTTTSSGTPSLPPPGLADPTTLRGALDCDLGLCPVTNTMPIRRLQLMEKATPSTPLIMAWVEVPSLRVVRSDQVYASDPLTAPGIVQYASAGGEFKSKLVIDGDGIVNDYPGLAQRLHLPK